MFILFGFKTAFRTLFSRPGTCQYCHTFSQHHLEERATKLTLFFIPIITVKRSYGLTCSRCGYSNGLTRQQKDAILA